MGDAEFVDRFDAAARFGAYLRIVREGDVGAGDEIVVVPRADGVTAITVPELAACHATCDAAFLERIAADGAVADEIGDSATREPRAGDVRLARGAAVSNASTIRASTRRGRRRW